MDFVSSPGSSASSSPISVGWPSASSRSSSSSYSGRSISSSSKSMTCAFPSWPTGPSLSGFQSPFHSSAPSAFISDLDLFPEDLLEGATPYLQEAPAPPREHVIPTAMPLQPLFAIEKPKKQRRRSSGKKRSSSKPMTPIVESLEAPE
jgi:hypothetical protein